jgi:hypothetical protein
LHLPSAYRHHVAGALPLIKLRNNHDRLMSRRSITQGPMRSPRFWLALAALPPLDAVTAYFAFPLVWYMGGHRGQSYDPIQPARAFALLTGILSVFVTCAAAPTVIWMKKHGAITLRHLLLAGVALGNAPFFGIVAAIVLPFTVMHIAAGTISQHLSPVSDLIAGTLRSLALGSTMGAWSAFVFWMIAFGQPRRKPQPTDR